MSETKTVVLPDDNQDIQEVKRTSRRKRISSDSSVTIGDRENSRRKPNIYNQVLNYHFAPHQTSLLLYWHHLLFLFLQHLSSNHTYLKFLIHILYTKMQQELVSVIDAIRLKLIIKTSAECVLYVFGK